MTRKLLAILALLLCLSVLVGCAAETSSRRRRKNRDDDDDENTTTTTSSDNEQESEEEEDEQDPDLAYFASMTEEEIAAEIFAPAETAYGCFDGWASLAYDMETIAEIDGYTYFLALPFQSELHTSLDLSVYENFRTYLNGFFTKEFTEQLLDMPMYHNVNGKLYGMPAGRGGILGYRDHHYAVKSVEKDRVVYVVTVEYIKEEYLDLLWDQENPEITDDMLNIEKYEFVRVRENGNWVFANFDSWC